ncbi:hypothetical protein N7493_003887 [Penicillium malachiteum]|uniref:Zn(2)-C6 fungal-type domain-containing protein n=1 Tax=Penicillium malachiteum TaxID=1324776 RepID=A0AAD6HQH4_9EURO|nr:hypothetical protein N7493_003887 [Penicillium malachiteum]
MSLSKQAKGGTGQMPKSVKVRSTCNACQQAKIRCSHEKPSCRRCQKHNIDCIYSVSRRLGRPAKKKEPRSELEEQGGGSSPETLDLRLRASKTNVKVEDEQYPPISAEAKMDECSTLEMDFTSETWLQDLMSCRSTGGPSNSAFQLEEPYGDAIDSEDTFDASSEYMRHPGSLPSHMVGDPYFPVIPTVLERSQNFEPDIKGFHNSEHLVSHELKDTDSSPWIYESTSLKFEMQPVSDPWNLDRSNPPNNSILDHSTLNYCQLQSPSASHESETYSPEEPDFLNPLDNNLSFSCNCYKQAMSELIRSGLHAGPDGSCSIDNIIACQKDLLLQTECILECKMCSQSEVQANMLMIIIVTIDSLLSTLDVIASTARSGVDEQNISADQVHPGGGYKSHVDVCPLIIDGLRVPLEERSYFIRQVLQVRLSMLLLTIRRIRVCMQQHLTAVLSRGRLLMIMETDRRLQLIMMKIKMAVG